MKNKDSKKNKKEKQKVLNAKAVFLNRIVNPGATGKAPCQFFLADFRRDSLIAGFFLKEWKICSGNYKNESVIPLQFVFPNKNECVCLPNAIFFLHFF